MNMRRNLKLGRLASPALALAVIVLGAVCVLRAEPQAAQPKYSMAEYKAYQSAAAETNAQQKVKLLDAFVAQYPNSDLLPYVYDEYLKADSQLQQWPKVLEYFDKKLAMPNMDKGARLQALYGRAQTFDLAVKPTDPNLKEQATKARDAALEGLKVLDTIEKPANATDEQFAAGKKQLAAQFLNTAARASMQLKDYKAAAENYHASLQQNPQQPNDEYYMGLAFLQETPPAVLPGFWAVARAVDEKLPESDKVTAFLRGKLSEYETTGCDALIDPQLKDLLAQAQASEDPPAGFSIPSAADLAKVREKDTAGLLAGLRAGGDTAKLTWLTVCNGEFPEAFLAKIYEIDATTPDAIRVKAAIGTTEEEVTASTAADSDLKISGQPDAARMEKDGIFRFAGKLTGFTADPFHLSWENVKVNPEDIPEEKGKKPAKRPGKKP